MPLLRRFTGLWHASACMRGNPSAPEDLTLAVEYADTSAFFDGAALAHAH